MCLCPPVLWRLLCQSAPMMNNDMRQTIFILGGMLFILMCVGCKNAPADVISKALASTNVLFQPNLQEPITLSRSEAETLKRIVRRFNQRSNVRVEKDILPHELGRFILGDTRFGWLGKMLYFHDAATERYFMVEDTILGELAEAYFEVQGQPPLKNPSQDQWKEILSALEKSK
jgi:hypothetical protein